MIPPGTKKEWDENSAWHQALLIAYDQIRILEDAEERANNPSVF